MQNPIEEFLAQKNFAVVGSFRNEEKYAYKIFRELKAKGHKVFAVNPHAQQVDGEACYVSISDISSGVDVVDFVTPPQVTENILKECLKKGIKRAWLQPGSESEEAIKFCREHNIAVIYGVCVMLEGLKKEGKR